MARSAQLDEQGFPRFEWLVNRGRQKGTLIYYVFDLLRLGDVDLRREPLLRRKKRLGNVCRRSRSRGCSAKDAKSPYVEGPAVTQHWLKIKNKDFQPKEPVEF